MLKIIDGLQTMTDNFRGHKEQYKAACRMWCGGDVEAPGRAVKMDRNDPGPSRTRMVDAGEVVERVDRAWGQ
jgi:hypothetical protein